jgi:hypothetical protein
LEYMIGIVDPRFNSIFPPGKFPHRTFGPCRSARIAISLFKSDAIFRTNS